MTAEHGGHDVPPEWRALFRGRAAMLASHRGWDPGALDLARKLAGALDAPLVTATVTRLLVDLNRSPHNPRVFSEVTRGLPRGERRGLIERYHRPHWDAVRGRLQRALRGRGTVLHVAVHSFTPVLAGIRRKPDVALLYDPARPGERTLVAAWAPALAAALPSRCVRRNDPYRGRTDGLPTAMRRELGRGYVGIEIEVNQRHVGARGRFPAWVPDALLGSLSEALA
ncbi:MAG: N-formylglutamate amidohydrolase [Gemmatimonadales bacterium]